MEYSEKLKIASRELAKEFDIPEQKAGMMITFLNLEDVVFERYEESIMESENIKFNNWAEEEKMNPELF